MNHPSRDFDERGPHSFEEHYRLKNWEFYQYRTVNHEPLSEGTLAEYRTAWLNHPFGVGGRVKIIPRDINSLSRYTLRNNPKETVQEIRDRTYEAKNWFLNEGPFQFVRPLGFGGQGITIHFKWTPYPTGGSLTRPGTITEFMSWDIVLKVATEGWDDAAVRREEMQTRKMKRAAHCIQIFDAEEYNMVPQATPWAYEIPTEDDTSEPETSSGEESRDDDPPPKKPTRRERIEGDIDGVRHKIRTHMARVADQRKWYRRREKRLERARVQAAKGEPPDFNPEGWDLGRKDYMLLEFAPNGDLEHFIYRLNDSGEKVPNRVLWSFWQCLVKACVAMEYPPRKFHPRRREANSDFTPVNTVDGSKVGGKDLFEEVPPAKRRWAGKNMVHFDIDPRNILVFDVDVGGPDEEHRLVPRLKVTDFGCAQEIKPNKNNSYYLGYRSCGKVGHYAPEQFGADWEHIEATTRGGYELSESRVAGNYTSAMNVWQIALTMWQMITKSRAPRPPWPVKPPYEPYHYCPLILQQEKYNYVDKELRETMAHCMRHDPADRPSLLDLMQQAERASTKVFPGENDRTIQDWVHVIFHNAPVGDNDSGGGGSSSGPGSIPAVSGGGW
ncbi:kinase-like protein [Hypoxylon trugodes]|uniref:kinase-like protein n=1 Tax=Hypoxylon trugodes TaxID=326681 RepID=UPI00218F343F|nr:kinase-like protein [Hypoxylon trugodes]KAI1388252.1 kinase-like protein [Hypoxylon trugodes]